MNTLKAIHDRRSIKHFDPSHSMSESEIQTLMEHTLLSPTSFNMQNWRFVLVRDGEQKAQIKEAAWGQSQISDASLTIVLCADLQAHEQADRYWAKAPKETQEMIVPMIHKFYHDKPELQRDEALRSIGIAGQTIMLAAKSMGYDSCPMIGFDPVKVAEIIQLPDNYIIGMIIPVGKALKPANPRSGTIPMNEICFNEHF